MPTEYFLLCLGTHLKYSSCLYLTPKDTLGQAEEQMLGEPLPGYSCVRGLVGPAWWPGAC